MDTEVQRAVFQRDGQACVAPWLGASDRCATLEGYYPRATYRPDFEIDHVRGNRPIGSLSIGRQLGGYGKRPPNEEANLVTLCYHHHQGGWATANRYTLRLYLLYHEYRRLFEAYLAEPASPEYLARIQELLEERP